MVFFTRIALIRMMGCDIDYHNCPAKGRQAKLSVLPQFNPFAHVEVTGIEPADLIS